LFATPARRGTNVRVRKISVEGLFGRFNYEIPLNLDDRITIVHGPNGFGKTTLLRLVAGLFSRNNGTLLSTPYTKLEVDLDNGSSISVLRDVSASSPSDEIRRRLVFSYRGESSNESFTLQDIRPDHEHIPLHTIDEIIPELDREGPNLWRHVPSGELLSVGAVLERYSEVLGGRRSEPPPEWLQSVRQLVPVRLIEAERLQAARPARTRQANVSPGRAAKLYSQELGTIIKQTFTEYGTLSQSLDRSFPARVVTHRAPLAMDKLQAALEEIEAKRTRLTEAGLLEPEGEDTTVEVLQHVDESKLPVLSVYVQDTHQKLSVFDNLVARVERFKRSINDRFLYKRVFIGREGFSFKTTEGDPLDPASLSSGEQHEIVLLYELLFRAAENSLILLDEPEISLHVAWQEQFLSDLEATTALSQIDAIVATHSPQIIGDRWDLTVELKGPQHEVLSHAARRSE
jgi:ABC-type transport system involved in cytochrome c biogenesis ATPase subunit